MATTNNTHATTETEAQHTTIDVNCHICGVKLILILMASTILRDTATFIAKPQPTDR